jgi:hypothetical protein
VTVYFSDICDVINYCNWLPLADDHKILIHLVALYIGAEEECIRILVGNLEANKPLERPRHKWEDNIKMDLRSDWYGLDRSGSG